MRESQIEAYLVRRVKELGGEVRKVEWSGRRGAPDRFVMLPLCGRYGRNGTRCALWVELKNPDTIKTFPSDGRERAQAREHERMRKCGQWVEVIGTLEQVDEVLA